MAHFQSVSVSGALLRDSSDRNQLSLNGYRRSPNKEGHSVVGVSEINSEVEEINPHALITGALLLETRTCLIHLCSSLFISPCHHQPPSFS